MQVERDIKDKKKPQVERTNLNNINFRCVRERKEHVRGYVEKFPVHLIQRC